MLVVQLFEVLNNISASADNISTLKRHLEREAEHIFTQSDAQRKLKMCLDDLEHTGGLLKKLLQVGDVLCVCPCMYVCMYYELCVCPCIYVCIVCMYVSSLSWDSLPAVKCLCGLIPVDCISSHFLRSSHRDCSDRWRSPTWHPSSRRHSSH